jgi:hypothetical protein
MYNGLPLHPRLRALKGAQKPTLKVSTTTAEAAPGTASTIDGRSLAHSPDAVGCGIPDFQGLIFQAMLNDREVLIRQNQMQADLIRQLLAQNASLRASLGTHVPSGGVACTDTGSASRVPGNGH